MTDSSTWTVTDDLALPTGIRMRVVQSGLQHGEPVVLINGIFMNTATWEGLERALAPRYRVVRFDGRGQGESSKPEGPYTVDQHVGDLEALLDALGLGPVHLVGLSNGALTALELAGRRPELLRSLAVLDGFGRVDALMRAVLRSWRAALALGGTGGRFDVATPWVWGHTFLEDHEAWLLGLREEAAAADPRPVLALVEGALAYGEQQRDASPALRTYRGPLLTLVGEDDVLSPPRYSLALLRVAGRGQLVVVPRAGHAAPIERPEAVAEELDAFFERVSGGEEDA
ncbi:MAG: alpha/beta hydrolase [Deinococcales bacterium]